MLIPIMSCIFLSINRNPTRVHSTVNTYYLYLMLRLDVEVNMNQKHVFYQEIKMCFKVCKKMADPNHIQIQNWLVSITSKINPTRQCPHLFWLMMSSRLHWVSCLWSFKHMIEHNQLSSDAIKLLRYLRFWRYIGKLCSKNGGAIHL